MDAGITLTVGPVSRLTPGEAHRRPCQAPAGPGLPAAAGAACDRVYVDTSRNGSRRLCSTACRHRVKTAAFRPRRG